MKILVFTDLHGSLNALKALSQTQDFKQADKVVFLGDVTFGCSRPNECLDLLKQLKCDVYILGNNDSYICNHIPEADLETFSGGKLIQHEWMKKNISEENKEFMKTWPKSFKMTLNNKKFYFTHYQWEEFNNDTNVIDTPTEKNFEIRKEMFKNIEADYYILGHEHEQNYFTDGIKHYFCLGATGLKTPACYLLINSDENAIQLEEKYVDFDIYEEISLMDKAGYPYAKNKINN